MGQGVNTKMMQVALKHDIRVREGVKDGRVLLALVPGEGQRLLYDLDPCLSPGAPIHVALED